MPAKTDKQAITARIAGAIKKGLQKGKPGEPSTEMAKMPMKSLKKFMHTKKDKKVKKEGVIENARFFGVRKPSGEIAEKDMVFEFTNKSINKLISYDTFELILSTLISSHNVNTTSFIPSLPSLPSLLYFFIKYNKSFEYKFIKSSEDSTFIIFFNTYYFF